MTKKALLILSILLISTGFAQDISQLRVVGKAERMTGELIDKSIRDANGAICSGLIIVSDLTGLTFQSSNGIVKINSKPGKDFLFLSPDERVVTVYCTGYEPLKIILSEVSVRLKSGEVWQVRITGDKKIDAIPVNILVNQEAEIFIDGISKGKGKEQTINLSAGSYQLRLVKEGYKTIEGTIEVSATKNLFRYEITSIDPVVVSINSTPIGAKIFIDAMENGETYKQLFLYPGIYSLKIQRSGFLDINENIEIKETGENNFSYSLVKNTGYLKIEIDPKDAEVFINKNKQYSINRIELAPGTYKIEVSKQHYYPKEDVVSLSIGDSVTKQLKLEAKVGSLQFSVQPADAKVILERDGIQVESWQGLKLKKNILEGKYQIKSIAEGYKSAVKYVEIKENQNSVIDITLEIGSNCVTKITYEGKTYNTEQIGDQCWLKENLDVGEMIEGDDDQENNRTIEKYCHNDDPANCTTYGGLYQWDETMQYTTTEGAKGICPTGWHIPSKAEFETLKTNVSDNGNSLKVIGRELGKKVGTNTSGFSALMAGRHIKNGDFGTIGKYTNFWSSTGNDASSAYCLSLLFGNISVSNDNSSVYAYSVRCIKD